ncbi:hypothetical protein KHQ82_04225 [Mycoplasmatota bacterium]|nr:hypothetical protein KHQ82_04225 [Mycoplasmatota bacterium]
MKIRKGFKLYAIVTQYLMQTVALVVFGVYFGSKLDIKYGTENLYSGLLGILGIFVGLITFAIFVYRYGDKNGKK